MPVSNWPGYEYFYLAEQAGLARAQAVPLNTVEFADPQAIVHAYVCGDLAIAKMATVEAVDICARVPERCPVVALVLDELGGRRSGDGAPGHHCDRAAAGRAGGG